MTDLVQGHAPPPPPGIAASRSPPHQSIPQPSLDRYMSPSPIRNGLSPFDEPGVNPPLQGFAPHAESSRAGSAYSGQSPKLPQGVLGNLMQSFEVAKEQCRSNAKPHEELIIHSRAAGR